MPIDRLSTLLWSRLKAIYLSWLKPERFYLLLGKHRGSTGDGLSWCCLTSEGYPGVMQHVVSAKSSSVLLYSIKSKK